MNPSERQVIQGLLDLLERTDSYCEFCEQHAPKDEMGYVIGPIPHTSDCAVGIAEALLAIPTKRLTWFLVSVAGAIDHPQKAGSILQHSAEWHIQATSAEYARELGCNLWARMPNTCLDYGRLASAKELTEEEVKKYRLVLLRSIRI